MKVSLRIFKKTLLVYLIIGFTASSTAAMPKKSSSSRLTNFQSFAISQDPILKGTEIISDDKEKTLYISPTSKKSQAGLFQAVASPECTILKSHYDLTYLMPRVPVDKFADIAKQGPFSPFFDAKFGNYIRHAGMLQTIAKKMQEISQLKERNKDQVLAFAQAKALFEAAQSDYNIAEASYAELSKNIVSLNEQLSYATDAQEKTRLEAQIREAQKFKASEDGPRREKVRASIAALAPLRPKYAEAKAKYDLAMPTLADLALEQSTLTTIFDAMQSLSNKQFSENERALQQFESATVGTATASYSIWHDEEARLRSAIVAYGRRETYFSKHSVARLPIHNIRLKKPVGQTVESSVSGTFSGDTTIAVKKVGSPADGMIISDEIRLSTKPTFVKDGSAVVPEIKELSNDGAGTYTNLVTRGGFCTGSSKRNKRTISAAFAQGDYQTRNSFDVYEYRERTTNVLAQSVALEYEFYVRTDPIGVTCTMDIDKFRSFARDTGTSGFLFWRKEWSEQQRQLVDNSGIICNVTMSPTGENPNHDEQAKRIEAIRQAMMQELAAEFILTYAKSWEVALTLPALPQKREGAFAAGQALMTLCGANIYCGISSVILKSGDDLFGSHADRVRNREYLSGKIRRAYDESSWTISNGTAVIDLTVSL